MAKSFWEDLFDIGVGIGLTILGIKIIQALSNPNQTYVPPQQYTIQDLRVETRAGLSILRQENAQLKDRLTALERENARLRPFADFLELKQKEAEQERKIALPKPKLHLWR